VAGPNAIETGAGAGVGEGLKAMTLHVRRSWARVGAAAVALLGVGAVFAAQPTPGGMNLQPSASPIMTEIHWFHSAILLPIITAVSLFVLALLAYCVLRFNGKANPVPSKTTHHTGLEVAWTVVPIIILIVIAIPSFQLLYRQETLPRIDMTVKAIGSSWRWTYSYPDHGNFEFRSDMLREEGGERLRVAQQMGRTPEEMPRLLAVDNEMVVPVNKNIRVIVTSTDVIHAWTVPAFGVKVDAVPGRLNELWFRAERPGIYYGQCSELCGRDHAYMPIAVRVVSEQDFTAWVEDARRRFAAVLSPNLIASADIAR
jgi:cytochrome c oxidase subunit 2